jgi:peptide/nickel transport system substrate-binding protein
MDQFRDELINSDVKGRNPFKDRRVRQAMYHAIDIEAIQTKTMRGFAAPTGGMTPSQLGSNLEHEKRLPFDRDKAKKQLAEAGYPNGFRSRHGLPNDRYINDEQICQALVNTWAQIGVKVKLTTMPKAIYFPKLLKHDTSLYLLGWARQTNDAQEVLTPVLHSNAAGGQGRFNYGRYVDARLDQLIDQAAVEMNPEKRASLLAKALKVHNDEIHHIPLHRQSIPWSMRKNVRVIHRPDNTLEVRWVHVD